MQPDIRPAEASRKPMSTIPEWVRTSISRGEFQQPAATLGARIVISLAALVVGMTVFVPVWAVHLSVPIAELTWMSYVGCALFTGLRLLTWHVWRKRAREWLVGEWHDLMGMPLVPTLIAIQISPTLMRLFEEDTESYQRAHDIALHCGLLPHDRSFT